MATSYKLLGDGKYIDSTGIAHERIPLNDFLNDSKNVFYWDGTDTSSSAESLALWQKIMDQAKTQSVIVCTKYSETAPGYYANLPAIFVINKNYTNGYLAEEGIPTPDEDGIIWYYFESLVTGTTEDRHDGEGYNFSFRGHMVEVRVNQDGQVVNAYIPFPEEKGVGLGSFGELSFLSTSQTNGRFEPTKDYDPATKKYVDEKDVGKGKSGTGENSEIFNNYSSNKAVGSFSHAEGTLTNATGDYSHAEGFSTTAQGKGSHTEGTGTLAEGEYAHAEGLGGNASGNYSHKEGSGCEAIGEDSHAEGNATVASGRASHAEGVQSQALGDYSHAEGRGTKTLMGPQHAAGKFNLAEDPNLVEMIGNGESDTARSNARTLDWNGNEVLAGKLTLGVGPTANMDAATKKYVDDLIASLTSRITELESQYSQIAVDPIDTTDKNIWIQTS